MEARRRLLFLATAMAATTGLAVATTGCGPAVPYVQVAIPEVSLSAVEYDVLVRNSLPLTELRQMAEQAALTLQFDVTEVDAFFDDHYRWGDKAVVLGVEGSDVVVLTTRCAVDPYAPGRDLQTQDGSGAQEFLEATLTLRPSGGAPVVLRHNVDSRQTPDVRVVFPNRDVDLALLYVPSSRNAGRALQQLQQMGLTNPTEVITKIAGEVQRLFGFDFVIRSRACDDLVLGQRDMTGPLGKLLKLALVVAAWEFAIQPLALDLADAFSSGSVLEGLTEFAEAAAASPSLPLEILGPEFAFGADGSLQIDSDSLVAGATRLLLVDVLSLSEGQRDVVEDFLDAALGDHPLEASTFETMAGLVSQVFVPDRRMNLNLELIARGLAQLDTDNPVAVERYPMFVEAALEALRTGAGFAAGWAQDEGYVEALERLAELAAESPLAELGMR